MSKKNLFLLAAGYLAGGLVASLYGKKKPGELKKDLNKAKQTGESDFKVLFDNFLDTHVNLIKNIESELLTEENKKLFNEKKDQLLKVAESYKQEGLKIIEELKEKGVDYVSEASHQLDQAYQDKKDELDQLKEVAPEKVTELKDNLLSTFEELKEKLKNIK